MPQTILITGCSSGIGAAMAEEFHKQGHRVFASARRPESLAPLADKGIETLSLDVNDDASIAAAMASVETCRPVRPSVVCGRRGDSLMRHSLPA